MSGNHFLELVVASAIGAGLAGSCGNCGLEERMTKKITTEIRREVTDSENRITTQLNNLEEYQLGVITSTTYQVNGQQYKCIIGEE